MTHFTLYILLIGAEKSVMHFYRVRRTSIFRTKAFQLVIELENGHIFRVNLSPTMRNFRLCQGIKAVLVERFPERVYTGRISFFK